jgi:hypothetical protein
MRITSLGPLKNKLALPQKLAQVSPKTGGGQRIVEEFAQPTTVIAGGVIVKNGFKSPPNSATAVLLATNGSTQLAENTSTGAGTGNQRVSLPVSAKVKGQGYYAALAVIGILLVGALFWDRGAV